MTDRVVNLQAYRESAREQARLASLLRLVPQDVQVALDIGARDGYISIALSRSARRVIALDLERPSFVAERVTTVAGNVTDLDFAAGSVDCVLCAEVLEHLPPPLLPRACREIARVTGSVAVIGVPFRQDLRVNRTRCPSCGGINPPWGHVNGFDQRRLVDLFRPMRLTAVDLVWVTRPEQTNVLSAALMKMAGFPYGTYNQDEPCVACGSPVRRLRVPTPAERACAGVSMAIDRIYRRSLPARATWMHARFEQP